MTSAKMKPDGMKKAPAIEDDVEGHRLAKPSPDGMKKAPAIEDDVEGHNFGTLNPILARDLMRSKERDIERAASRNNLVSEAKRAPTRKA
jgi:hypothetical protein